MYGVNETNGLINGAKYHAEERIRRVDWTEKGLTITRLRLLSDPGFPFWDVSYCHGKMDNGDLVRVELPFAQLPKRGMKQALYAEAQRTGKYIAGLFTSISTLN